VWFLFLLLFFFGSFIMKWNGSMKRTKGEKERRKRTTCSFCCVCFVLIKFTHFFCNLIKRKTTTKGTTDNSLTFPFVFLSSLFFLLFGLIVSDKRPHELSQIRRKTKRKELGEVSELCALVFLCFYSVHAFSSFHCNRIKGKGKTQRTQPGSRGPFVSKVGSFVLFPFVLSLHASFFIVSERQKEKAKRNHSQQLMVVFCLFFVPFIKITLFIPFQLYFNEREQKNKVNTRLHLNFLFSLSFVLIEWKER